MDGLIVNQPYANLIVQGKKQWELRSRHPPSNKLNSEIYLLSRGKILGIINIRQSHGPLSLDELEECLHLHRSELGGLDKSFTSFAWEIELCDAFTEPKKYVHPNGARVWVKDVLPAEVYEKNMLTHYT